MDVPFSTGFVAPDVVAVGRAVVVVVVAVADAVVAAVYVDN